MSQVAKIITIVIFALVEVFFVWLLIRINRKHKEEPVNYFTYKSTILWGICVTFFLLFIYAFFW